MKACVIIPTYNEAKEIGNVIRRLRQQNLDVVVIDDGSKDNTCLIAKENGASVIRNEINEGKGASLIKGFNYAIENNFDAVITMDGDGQHIPEEVSNFINAAGHSLAGLLIGDRMALSKGMPVLRWLTNKVMSWLISKAAGQPIPDTQCGFRLIKTEALKKIQLKTKKYETESEIIFKISRAGYQIKSIPIKTVYQNGRSHINPFIDTLRFFKFLIKGILGQN
jgi:glycosyltransferase involved in cell wall biosynthesis